MRTASGPAVNDSSSKKGNGVQPRATRRRGIRPITMVIAGLLLLLSLASMGAAYFGIWPPKAGNSETIAEKWNRTRTATPLAQRALGLKIDKLGAPTKDGDTVVVRLHVTNNVKASPIATGTPQAGAPAPPAEPATVKNGLINVIFYNETNGQQVVVGSGIGSVVDLAPGQSKDIEVRATAVRDFSPATKYEAFADSVWTDKDPVKAAESTPGSSPSGSPTP